jgi:DNA helicase-2/ATP-dependent DNA helicase PcrA
MRLSYSKLNTYRQCPLRYRFTYLERLPRRPRKLFRAARRIHHALMRWLTYAKAGEPRWDEVKTAYDAAWGVLQDPALAETRDYLEGLQILEEYHAVNRERPCRPVMLEHKFSVPLGPHVLIGALDRVDATDSGYEVIDYKLDRELRTQETVDADLQLGLYHLALEEANGISPEALTLYFLRHNVRRTTLRTPQQSSELLRWVVATGNDIQSERRWEPCPGDHCGGCDFKAACPVHTGGHLAPLAPRLESGQMSLLLPGTADSDDPVDALEAPGTQLALPLG